jgi:hypothetical protein
MNERRMLRMKVEMTRSLVIDALALRLEDGSFGIVLRFVPKAIQG